MPDQPPPERDSPEQGSPEHGKALAELVGVMDRLRRECPWDAKQTHLSLRPYLLEETYETLDALDRRDLAELREELGDLLLQVFFHARIAAERSDGTGFDIDDVARGITTKLIRRHPHVFADVQVADADEVRRNWDKIKATERAGAGASAVSALDGVPMAQPALALATQLQRRAEAAGVPAELADLSERAAACGADAAAPVSELGAELFSLVARARAAGLNPELELRNAALVFSDRVRAWESGSTG
jgi:XTP/dITP diphosphohydrolase